MPRTYKPVLNRKRVHGSSSVEDLAKAADLVKEGLSIKKAAERCNVKKSTLHDFIKKARDKKTSKPVGGQTYISEKDEKILADTIHKIAEWGFPLSFIEGRYMLKSLLDEQGQGSRWKDNLPGWDWFYGFRNRNKLSARLTSNMKKARSKMNPEHVRNFFVEYTQVFKDNDIHPENIMNYDETILSDDPGSQWVMVRRGRHRVEKVEDTNKTIISIMWAGTAAGQILPPCVVYRGEGTWTSWTAGAPHGTLFLHSERGWFEAKTFEEWVCNIVLPFYKDKCGVKILIGDNLGSHFSARVVREALAHNIMFVMLPTNSSHIFQPLQVTFTPMIMHWADILDWWKRESHRGDPFPKEVLPLLLNKLWVMLESNFSYYLKAGFEACGLYPVDELQILRMLPLKPDGYTTQILKVEP